MSEKDTVTKSYMQDSTFFADAFNFLMYNGKQVIDPAQLKPIDTSSIVLPYAGDQQPIPAQKYRDILKSVTAMEDGETAYLILGIENQSQIHYAMPVRNMLYDAMQYLAQVDSTAKRHRKDNTHAPTSAEYLSGFYRADKLIPVITLTLFFSDDKWTAREIFTACSPPMSLFLNLLTIITFISLFQQKLKTTNLKNSTQS